MCLCAGVLSLHGALEINQVSMDVVGFIVFDIPVTENIKNIKNINGHGNLEVYGVIRQPLGCIRQKP